MTDESPLSSPLRPGGSDDEIRSSVEGQRIRAQLRAKLFGADDAEVNIGPYVLGRRLGSGGAGTVYLAEHKATGEEVALKILRNPTATEERRLLREGKAMTRLRHPNIVRVLEVGEHERGVFVAMEFVRGGTLGPWMRDARAQEDVITMIEGIAAGLTAAHEVGVVHRDIKPANILIDEDETPHVSDFGLAAAVPGSPAEDLSAFSGRLTATGATMGTVGYMAAEQLLGRTVSPATDQFALGVTTFEALYGASPFAGATMDAVALSIVNGSVQTPSDEPSALLEVVVRALQPDPENRFTSVAAYAAALREALERKPAAGWWAKLWASKR